MATWKCVCEKHLKANALAIATWVNRYSWGKQQTNLKVQEERLWNEIFLGIRAMKSSHILLRIQKTTECPGLVYERCATTIRAQLQIFGFFVFSCFQVFREIAVKSQVDYYDDETGTSRTIHNKKYRLYKICVGNPLNKQTNEKLQKNRTATTKIPGEQENPIFNTKIMRHTTKQEHMIHTQGKKRNQHKLSLKKPRH